MPRARLTPEPAIEAEVAALLAERGEAAGSVVLRPCRTGGNNRVYVVETGAGRVIAKRYFTSLSDSRDRLQAEWEFLCYAAGAGIECVPRPLARDTRARLALYEFIDGSPLSASDIGPPEIAAAVDLVLALNRPESSAAARLGAASEACFDVAAHFAVIDRRLARLRATEPASAIDRDAARFVERIARVWERLQESIATALVRGGFGVDDELPADSRCLSPSDFGYHNALRRPGGTLAFLDFEYAGWDDPAKLVADFLCQPAVPVDPALGEIFCSRVLAGLGCGETMRERARILRPLFAVKWCCIMLNAFVRDGMDRRFFADQETDEHAYKRAQLAKSEARLRQVTEEHLPWPT